MIRVTSWVEACGDDEYENGWEVFLTNGVKLTSETSETQSRDEMSESN